MAKFRFKHQPDVLIEAERWVPYRKLSFVKAVISPVLEPSRTNPSGKYAQLPNGKTVEYGNWVINSDPLTVLQDRDFRVYYEPEALTCHVTHLGMSPQLMAHIKNDVEERINSGWEFKGLGNGPGPEGMPGVYLLYICRDYGGL